MINICGVNISKKKKIFFGIIKIFGIGRKISKKICQNNFFMNKNFFDLNKNDIEILINSINKYLIENKLKIFIKNNIKNILELNNYKSIRHKKKLPCRGQRTKTNAKCRKRMIHEII